MNLALSAVGRAKQSAKGTPATAPTSWHGVTGGKLVDLPIEQNPDEETTGLAAQQGEERESVLPAGDFGYRPRPKCIGEALLAILGSVQTTGASAPYTHVFTAGSSVPYYTLFGKKDTELNTVSDAKLAEFKIGFDGNKPLECNETWAGCNFGYPASITPGAGADETLDAKFRTLGAGGFFKYAGSGTSTAAAKALSGSISLSREITPDIIAGALLPDDVNEAMLMAEAEMVIRAATLADQRLILTGAVDGTTPVDTIYGALDWKFVLGTNSLQLASTRVAWTCETPDVDPKGGPAALTLKGRFYIPTGSTTPLTATLINGRASY